MALWSEQRESRVGGLEREKMEEGSGMSKWDMEDGRGWLYFKEG